MHMSRELARSYSRCMEAKSAPPCAIRYFEALIIRHSELRHQIPTRTNGYYFGERFIKRFEAGPLIGQDGHSACRCLEKPNAR